MQLPFSREQFFEVFGSYNSALWPGVVALWVASVVIVVLLLASPRRPSDRVIGGLLSAHWAWSALAYHGAFFTSINPAAWAFTALFLVEAVLLFWRGTVRASLRFAAKPSRWAVLAWALIAYSLVYPAINAAQHGSFSRIPTFGVPCPTTILTVGLLMLARPRSVALSVIPIAWAAIGGSAAFLFGVRADYALPIAGGVMLLSMLQQTDKTRSIRHTIRPSPL